MKFNLSKKIFAITLSLLIGLMGITLIFQLLFFQQFYEQRKQSNLTAEITKFKTMYSYQLSDKTTITNALSAIEARTNSKIVIESNDGNLLYLANGTNNKPTGDPTDFDFCRELIENSSLVSEVKDYDEVKSQTFYNKSSSTKKIGVISAISSNEKNDSIIVAVASIQPITEASSVIAEFYSYIFLGFLLVAIILSLVYSQFISKPLVKMNRIAKKMAKLDFEEKCKVTSSDEIGSLGSTLNFLSEKLDSSLEDLRFKNKKLQDDIILERKLETMRKDFVDSVSHELKTPIGIIEGYAEGIRDGIVKDQDIVSYLDIIIDESKKMGILVSNMLELSKLENDTDNPNFEIFNINRLINNVVKKHSIHASNYNLTIEFKQNTEYSYVLADRFHMEQVLTNLITNAIKYTEPYKHILVSISEIENEYEIKVFNEGAHLDEKEIPKLFDRFYRHDKSGNRKTNSTGLGLPIVKRLLDINNSKFELRNASDGVEFVLRLAKQEITEEEL